MICALVFACEDKPGEGLQGGDGGTGTGGADAGDAGHEIDLPPEAICSDCYSRFGASATYVPANGRVLIAAGVRLENEAGVPVLSYPRVLELYDPPSDLTRELGELTRGGARARHTATLLDDGRVLIAGGETHVALANESLRSAVLLDPGDPSGVKVLETIAMNEARTGHSAVKLADGRVLISGGRILNTGASRPEDHQYSQSVEIFDPASNTFILAGGTLVFRRYLHSAVLLPSGDVIISGGTSGTGGERTIERLRVSGTSINSTVIAELDGAGAVAHRAGVLASGMVVYSGGYSRIEDVETPSGSPQNPKRTLEVRQKLEDGFATCTFDTQVDRGFHTMTVLGNHVLLAGGRGEDGSALADVELLKNIHTCMGPDEQQRMQLCEPVAEHAAVQVGDSDTVVLIGGRQTTGGEPFGRSIGKIQRISLRR